MPIATGNWGFNAAFPNLTVQMGHLSQSSTQSGDEVIYPPVPDTVPSPYYSWHFSKYASTPRNYYGYNNRFQQLTLGTYTAPYPNLHPNSTNPTAWEFDTNNIAKILQRAVTTQNPCFYTEENFTYTLQVNFTRSFTAVGGSCQTNSEFFLGSLPVSEFFTMDVLPPICVPIPEACLISGENGAGGDGGTNNNTGGNGGYTSGDLCDFRAARTGARHSFMLVIGDSYTTRELVCAITHHVYTQTNGTTRKYGHYLEAKIISNTQPTYTLTIQDPNITGIRFNLIRNDGTLRVSITKITGNSQQTELSPYIYPIRFPKKVTFLNTIYNIGNGYSIVEEKLTNYRVTNNTTEPTNTQFKIQPNNPSYTTKLTLETAEGDNLTKIDSFIRVRFSRQATPEVFENATKVGSKWEIQNISTRNQIHTVELVGKRPIESIAWSAEYTSDADDPPPPPPQEPKFAFFLRLQRYGYRVGPFERGTEIDECFVSDNPITNQIQAINLQRFGPMISLIHPNDIRHPQADEFRYLFVNHIDLEEENMEYAAGTFGPGFKLEIYQFDIKNWNYNPSGYDIGLKNMTNTYTKGHPIFVDVQPVENPDMYFPSYNWNTNTVKIYRYNNSTNSFEEIAANTPVNIKIAVLVVFKST